MGSGFGVQIVVAIVVEWIVVSIVVAIFVDNDWDNDYDNDGRSTMIKTMIETTIGRSTMIGTRIMTTGRSTMKRFMVTGALALGLGLGLSSAQADVRVSSIFCDHAVLQRDLPVPVWGTAEPGEQVTVKVGSAQETTTADAQGKWMLRLPAMKMNTVGQEMVVSGKNTVTIQDVLVGDVWICGGQSNMQLSLKDCDAKEDIATAEFPLLRCLMTTNIPSRSKPRSEVAGAWAVCTSNTASSFTGAGFYFARRLLKETGVPMGLIEISFGGTCIAASIPAEGFDLEPWLKQQPGNVYEGMLRQGDHIALSAVHLSKGKPAAPYGIKGGLWYQGEWNGGDTSYAREMRALIGGWRKVWNQGDFPVYFVQLPSDWFVDGYGCPPSGEPDGEDGIGLAITRMELFKSLQITNTGMAVTIDVGGGIHPVNKFDVGERLALWALRDLYGKKDLVVSGPLYRELKIEGNKIRLKFDHVGSGLMVGSKKGKAPAVEVKDGKLRPFAICGDDPTSPVGSVAASKQWSWADAVIDGSDVVVSSSAVTNPVAVRYAYSCAPKEHNLFNKEGLPAAAFRTDEWGLMEPQGRKIVLFKSWPPEWDGNYRMQAPEDTTVEVSIRSNKLVKLIVTPASRRTDLVITPPFRDPMGFVVEPAAGEVPLPVRFDATSVEGPAGKIVSYAWDFGDGAKAEGVTTAHTYAKAGTYTVALQIKDAQGHADIVPRIITVTPVDTVAPTVVAASAPGQTNRVVVTFSEPVQKEDAEAIANYTAASGLQVVAAKRESDGATVTLTTTPLARGEYSIAVKGIRDLARKPNVLAATSKKFRYEGLYAWLKLNEGKGLVAADASGNNPVSKLKGLTWTNTAGRVAVSFNGQWGLLDTSTTLEDLALPFSISFWVNPAAQQRICANIFGNTGYDSPAGFCGLSMQQDVGATNRYAFSYGIGKRETCGTPSVQLATDQWQHVAVVCDGSNNVIYVDGVEKCRAPAKGAFVSNRGMALRLGYWDQNRFFKGCLSDFRIYRTALSPAEVQAVMKE
jgi:sialate O-acetylesterase